MKFGVIIAGPRSKTKNIGDYIQSLAQIQYVGNDFVPIERERISQYRNEPDSDCKVKTIMSAWWMWEPGNWPPAPSIEPCMVSMHISPLAASEMLGPEGIEYFKKHQPIGCRDKGTMRLLQSKGIECYFSACLTLTLGRTYGLGCGKREGILFCDPFIPPIRRRKIWRLLPCIPTIVTNFASISKLARKDFFQQYVGNGDLSFEGKVKTKIKGYINAISFFKVYSSKFTPNLLVKAEYISNLADTRTYLSNSILFDLAEERIRKFAKAKLVVTSRIHCALPCVGLETPVIFVMHDDMNDKGTKFNTPGRFEGLTDFFRVLNICENRMCSQDDVLRYTGRIGANTEIKNKSGWKQYEEKLHRVCMNFVTSL